MTEATVEFGQPKRVVIRLPSWVGDAVMVSPALRALRRRFPDSEFIAVGKKHLAALLSGIPEPVGSDPPRPLYDVFEPTAKDQLDIVRRIQKHEAELGLVFPHSFRSALELARARVTRRVGYARQGRSSLLTEALPPHRQRRTASWRDLSRVARLSLAAKVSHAWWLSKVRRQPALLKLRRDIEDVIPVPMIEQYTELAAVVGAVDDGLGPRLGYSADTAEQAVQSLSRLGLAAGERYICVNPGASFGASKVYPTEQLAEAARRVADELDARCVVLCGPGEERLAETVALAVGPRAIDSSKNLLALDVLKPVLASSDVLLTTDTGPWHIANAVGVRAVAVLGPTDPRYTASRLEGQRVVRTIVPCGPCHEKQCPLDHRCMTEIGPERVAAAAVGLCDAP